MAAAACASFEGHWWTSMETASEILQPAERGASESFELTERIDLVKLAACHAAHWGLGC